MLTRILLVLERWARYARTAAAIGCLFLSVRFFWLTSEAALHRMNPHPEERSSTSPEQETSPPSSPLLDTVNKADNSAQRPDLSELRRLAGEAPDPPEKKGAEKKQPRNILVDLGPARSAVYLNGRLVGKTPYGGQYACEEGKEIVIEVLPPTGAPLRRTAPCRGTAISALE